MTIIERLEVKKSEFQSQYDALTYSSVPKGILKKKIEILNELMVAYQSTSAPASLSEAEEILNQQVGFEEQKKEFLESLEIAEFWGPQGVKKKPLILGLVGPVGTGKSSFSKIVSQTLGKKFFSVSLGGLSDPSVLIGSEANSPANNMGQLAQALMETKTPDPVILLDEIDKTGLSLKNCLVNVLDPTQNQEIWDYFLEVKLDFSQVTFIITANDRKKIPDSLADRMLVIELAGYTAEKKQEIANKIIQKWFVENEKLNQKNFEITSNALETLINKSKEKGVRNLKKGLDRIFNYCLLQWAREIKQGKAASKITVNSALVNQVIPNAFFDVEQEGPANDRAELAKIEKELAKLQSENEKVARILSQNQNELAKIKQKNQDLAEQVKSLVENSLNNRLNHQPVSYGWWIGGIVISLFVGFFFSFLFRKNRKKKL